MDEEKQEQITRLLLQWTAGDRGALDLLTASVYGEMRKIAEGCARNERPSHTLQPTALVNEAWLRLIKQAGLSFENRKQFYGLAAQLMRRILVDYARGARAGKRGGGERAVSLTDLELGVARDVDEFLALNQALDRLTAFRARQARVIELRYFAGLGVEEVAEFLSISAATVSREQKMAGAWLCKEMGTQEAALDNAKAAPS